METTSFDEEKTGTCLTLTFLSRVVKVFFLSADPHRRR